MMNESKCKLEIPSPHNKKCTHLASSPCSSSQLVKGKWFWERGGAYCLVFASVLMLSYSNLHGQDPATTNKSAPLAAANIESGDVEIGYSRVFIFVGKRGAGHEHGVEGKLQKGKLHLNQPGGQTEKLGELVFDMTTFAADTDVARKYVGLTGKTDAATQKSVNDNLHGKAVLNTSKYPTATFVIKKLEPTGKKSKRGFDELKMTGDFTLHGTTKSIEILADSEKVNGWHHVRGSFSILQSEYGMKPFSMLLGAVGVTDQLDIYGDLFVAP